MKKQTKLHVNRETLRVLKEGSLREAVGGAIAEVTAVENNCQPVAGAANGRG